MKTMYPK